MSLTLVPVYPRSTNRCAADSSSALRVSRALSCTTVPPSLKRSKNRGEWVRGPVADSPHVARGRSYYYSAVLARGSRSSFFADGEESFLKVCGLLSGRQGGGPSKSLLMRRGDRIPQWRHRPVPGGAAMVVLGNSVTRNGDCGVLGAKLT